MSMKLLRADDAKGIESQVGQWLKEGWDLYGPIVTAHKFMIGQWLVQSYSYHEYRLVSALTFSDVERDVLSLQAEGYDLFQFTVGWNGMMLQWMCRATQSEFRYFGTTDSANAPSYNVIERGEPTFRLVPSILAGAPPLVVVDVP